MHPHGTGQGKVAQLPAQAHLTAYTHTRCHYSAGKLPLLLNLVFPSQLTCKRGDKTREKIFPEKTDAEDKQKGVFLKKQTNPPNSTFCSFLWGDWDESLARNSALT